MRRSAQAEKEKSLYTVASFAFVLRKGTDHKWRSHQGMISTHSMVKDTVIF